VFQLTVCFLQPLDRLDRHAGPLALGEVAPVGVARRPSRLTYTRKELAAIFQLTPASIMRNEVALGLRAARVSMSKRTVRYSEAKMRKLDWWQKLTDSGE
jgi:hypothetical protein